MTTPHSATFQHNFRRPPFTGIRHHGPLQLLPKQLRESVRDKPNPMGITTTWFCASPVTVHLPGEIGASSSVFPFGSADGEEPEWSEWIDFTPPSTTPEPMAVDSARHQEILATIEPLMCRMTSLGQPCNCASCTRPNPLSSDDDEGEEPHNSPPIVRKPGLGILHGNVDWLTHAPKLDTPFVPKLTLDDMTIGQTPVIPSTTLRRGPSRRFTSTANVPMYCSTSDLPPPLPFDELFKNEANPC